MDYRLWFAIWVIVLSEVFVILPWILVFLVFGGKATVQISVFSKDGSVISGWFRNVWHHFSYNCSKMMRRR